MFLGTFKHKLDSKKRLMLPSKIASKLSVDVVISKGFDGCLELRSAEAFNTYANKLMSYSSNKRESRILVRQLLANAIDLRTDKVNRILIPDTLLAETNINNDVVIIGLGDKLEIWDETTYNQFKTETDKTYIDIADKIDDHYEF